MNFKTKSETDHFLTTEMYFKTKLDKYRQIHKFGVGSQMTSYDESNSRNDRIWWLSDHLRIAIKMRKN